MELALWALRIYDVLMTSFIIYHLYTKWGSKYVWGWYVDKEKKVDVSDIEAVCVKLMEKYTPGSEWRLRFAPIHRYWGMTDMGVDSGIVGQTDMMAKTITINSRYINKAPLLSLWKHVMLHELAHARTNRMMHGHGIFFRWEGIKLGILPTTHVPLMYRNLLN